MRGCERGANNVCPCGANNRTSEFACKLAALVVRRQAPGPQLCLLCARAGFICPGHGSFAADFSFCPVGRVLTPPRNCRKTLVGASIARPCPFALQENYPGKCVAAVSGRATNGRPYTRNKAGMQFFDGLRSGQDRSLQLSRQRCGGYNKVGGNKKSHHGRWWEKFRLCLSLIIWQLHTFLCHQQALPCKCKFCPLPCR